MDPEELKKSLDYEKECVEKFGWYFHVVQEDDNDVFIDAHTHNLPEKFNHKNLQIVLNFDYDLISTVFHLLVEYIQDVEEINEGDILYGIIESYPITFKLVPDMFGKEEVLRIIFPDENGYFPDDDECEEAFKKQLEV